MKINEIRPFIPCKDYEQSKSFYKSLGFEGESAGDDMMIFEKDGCTFFLQNNFYSEEFSKNLMLQLIVADIEDAYEVVSQITDGDSKHSEIKQELWGKVVYLWGPSGELWHITQLSS